MGGATGAPARGDRRASEREGRRLALGSIFEADFGLRTPQRVLERRLEEEGTDPVASLHARTLVDAVVLHRDAIDAQIERRAPAYPVVQLARIDRALLRSAMGELLHCPATPTRVAISEWVEMARTYSGEPTRRLVNGVLGQVANASTRMGPHREGHAAGPDLETTDVTTDHKEGAPQ